MTDENRPAGAGRFRSVRSRITAWYGAIIALCVVAYSAAVGYSYARHVEDEWNRSAHEDVELATRAIVIDSNGAPSWPAGFLRTQPIEEAGGGHWIDVWTVGGTRLLAAGTMDPHLPGAPDAEAALHGEAPRTVSVPAGQFRVLSQRVDVDGVPVVIRAAVSEAAGREEIRSLWGELTVLSLTVIAFGCFGGYLLVRRSLGPLTRMADHARRITAEQLHERLVGEDAGTELDQLRDAFNETLARLENSFDQLRRFTADASHELRTPLTALRSVGEVSLRSARSAAEYREVIGMMLEEADRLSRLVDDLLTLARADARRATPVEDEVDLGAVVLDVVDRLAVLAEERRQVLDARTDAPVTVRGDRNALRQALMNLVDNAIKYAPEGTRISVAAGARNGNAILEVRDEGPGIPATHRAKIFERFYRIAADRSREKGGTGLGLSIVKTTAEDHGGRVEVESEEGRGSTFRIVLPNHAS